MGLEEESNLPAKLDSCLAFKHSDILKANNLKPISSTQKDSYAKKWEKMEDYFQDNFDNFLGYLRIVLVKEKAQHTLLKEFEKIFIKKWVITRR